MSRLKTPDLESSTLPESIEHQQEAGSTSISSGLERLAGYLDECCQQHKTATYLDVAEAINIQPPQRIHRLTVLLEALMEHDQKHHQPQRAALVVSRTNTGLPAKGFFLKAQALGLMLENNDQAYHQQCLDSLFNGPGEAKAGC